MADSLTPAQITELRQRQYNATLVLLRKDQTDLGVFRVKPDKPIPEHKPGQYTTLGLGYWEARTPGCQEETLKEGEETKLVRRSYSIAHPVTDDQGALRLTGQDDFLEFYIVLVRESDQPQAPALTPRLFMLKEGDRLNMGTKITGNYTLDTVQPDDTVLFLSTGTGEAPHNYMLWELLRRGHKGKIVAACCVRYKIDLGYMKLHDHLMKQHSNYMYLPLTTREADTIQNKVYIQDLILSGQLEERMGKPLDPATTHAFLCGNPKMIGVPHWHKATGDRTYPKPLGVIEILEQRGFTADQPQTKFKGNIHFEEYW